MVLYTGVESYMLEALVNNMIIAGSRKTICVTSKYIEREREPEEEGGSEGGGVYSLGWIKFLETVASHE